jgi:hypothetical protein
MRVLSARSRGEKIWNTRAERETTQRLRLAALSRSNTLPVENRATYPVERTLLTSGMTLAAVESLFRAESPVQTPEMEVRYAAPKESQFWRT